MQKVAKGVLWRGEMKVDVEILEQKGYHFLWIDGELWMWDIPEEAGKAKVNENEAYYKRCS